MSQQQAPLPSTSATTTSYPNPRHRTRSFTINCFCPCPTISHDFKAFTHYHFPNFTWARSRHTLHNHPPHPRSYQPPRLLSLTSRVSSFTLPLTLPKFPWSTASARSARSSPSPSPVRTNTPGETLQLRTPGHRTRKWTTREQRLCRREAALGSGKRHRSEPNLAGSAGDVKSRQAVVPEVEEYEKLGQEMSWQRSRGEEYEAPSGPPPGRANAHSHAQHEDYEAPLGPPPGRSDAHSQARQERYEAQLGPPPGRPDTHSQARQDEFQAPLGPPPGRSQAQRHSYSTQEDECEAPGGPPPGRLPSEQQSHASGALYSNNPFAGHSESAQTGTRPAESPNHFQSTQQATQAYSQPPPPPQIQEPTPTPSDPTQPQPPAQAPPPAYSANDNPHPWQSIPLPENDNDSLPPPPSFPGTTTHTASPTSNASYDAATAAHTWCELNSLFPAHPWAPAEREAIQAGSVGLATPPGKDIFKGTVQPTRGSKAWNSFDVSTKRGCADACLVSKLPVYSALDTAARAASSAGIDPSGSTPIATAYFTLTIRALPYPYENAEEAGVSLGFLAPPYPPWRQPGWERASLGVHGDDGRRYVNDTLGGANFTKPFKVGESIGLGMRFYLKQPGNQASDNSAPAQGLPAYGDAHANPAAAGGGAVYPREYSVRPFMTRHRGTLAVGPEQSWDLDEEVDAEVEQPGGVVGLRGDRDLYAAIGVFGGGVAVRVGFVGVREMAEQAPAVGQGQSQDGGSASASGRVVGGSGDKKKKGSSAAAEDEEDMGNGEGSSGSRWSAKLPWRRGKK